MSAPDVLTGFEGVGFTLLLNVAQFAIPGSLIDGVFSLSGIERTSLYVEEPKVHFFLVFLVFLSKTEAKPKSLSKIESFL